MTLEREAALAEGFRLWERRRHSTHTRGEEELHVNDYAYITYTYTGIT